MTYRHTVTGLAGVLAGTLILAGVGIPPGSGPVLLAMRQEATVKDGVYTTDQAARGRRQYESTCQRCHGADLTGGAGRSLTGDVFLRDWTGLTLDGLFERDAIDAARWVGDVGRRRLCRHHQLCAGAERLPPGGDELSGGLLREVVVEGEDGPDVVPNFALVQVVGCLTGGAADGWRLADASAEVRSGDPGPSVGDELAEVEATPLGTRAFDLMYVFPSPDAYVGHKVATKGLLIRGSGGGSDGAADSLNVTSVQSLSEVCER